MGILALIISILKIIGIILLIILALILLILLVLFFASIKFESTAEINKEIKFLINVKYLFGIVAYNYNNKTSESILKIFGVRIKSKEKIDKPIKNDFNQENIEQQIAKQHNIDQHNSKQQNTNIEKDISKKSPKSNKSNSKNDRKLENISKSKSEIKNKKTNFKFSNLFENFNDNYDNLKEIIKLIKKLIKRLLNSIKIKKLNVDFEYGIGEPYETGIICAIISSFLPIFSSKHIKNIKLKPNFEEKIFIGNLHIKMKTNIFKIILPILIFILKKPIRKIIFRKGE